MFNSNFLKKIIFLIVFFIILDISFSNNYSKKNLNFANIDIYVLENGSVTIKGITNVNSLMNITNTNKFTTFKDGYWKFKLITEETFKSYVYRLHIPKKAVVNYIKSTKNIIFKNDLDSGGTLIIGEDVKKD